MKYAIIRDNGTPSGFYDDSIHDVIPTNAIEITDEQWYECINNQGARKFENGALVTYIAPIIITIPQVVTMRQARLALRQNNLLTMVDNAITTSTDEDMKIEWEYATEVRRDWASLITMTTQLGITSSQLDDLFLLASSK